MPTTKDACKQGRSNQYGSVLFEQSLDSAQYKYYTKTNSSKYQRPSPTHCFYANFLTPVFDFFFSRAPPLQAYKTSSIFGGGRHCQNDSSGSFEWRMRNHMIVVVDRLFMCVPYITTSIVITTSGLLDIFAYKMAAQR